MTIETEVQFTANKADTKLILQIAQRYSLMYPHSEYKRQDLLMDLEACHSNGCPMNFQKLLGADDFNFMHDIDGIWRHINRETGKLMNCFSPRCHA